MIDASSSIRLWNKKQDDLISINAQHKQQQSYKTFTHLHIHTTLNRTSFNLAILIKLPDPCILEKKGVEIELLERKGRAMHAYIYSKDDIDRVGMREFSRAADLQYAYGVCINDPANNWITRRLYLKRKRWGIWQNRARPAAVATLERARKLNESLWDIARGGERATRRRRKSG